MARARLALPSHLPFKGPIQPVFRGAKPMMPAFSPLLESTPVALQREVAGRIRTLRVLKGRTVVGVASSSTEVFHVAEGSLQVVLYSPMGREVSVRQLGAGDIFGEMAALDGLPRSATVIAITDARLHMMSAADFQACLNASTAAAMWLARRLGAEVRRLTERVFELSALNVQTRLQCELLRLVRHSAQAGGGPVIDPAPTHAEIANRIGTNREAVTRELRSLVDQKLLRIQRRSMEFVDVSGLEDAVSRSLGETFRLLTSR